MDMDYLKEYLRMCNEYPNCDEGCPMFARAGWHCQEWMGENLDETKQIISDWVAAHPEKRMPTPNEWWQGKYPDAQYNRDAPCYRFFLPARMLVDWCTKTACQDCKRETPIPDEFAPLMGVEPVEVRG